MKQNYVVTIEDVTLSADKRIVDCVIIRAPDEATAAAEFVHSAYYGKCRHKHYVYSIHKARKASWIERFVWKFC